MTATAKHEGLEMRIQIATILVGLSLITACDSGNYKSTDEAPLEATNTSSGAENGDAAAEAEVVDEISEQQMLSGPQSNAVRSAKQYLSMTGFSKEGLIQQLSSDAGDGYSLNDATIAVDSLSVDWNENAAKSAKQYLSMTGFSCDGLIEQLSSSAGDKYTVEQATYGARAAGAC
ncbi:Ltp family lipoprotein [Blastomonas fulva]|uniref:Ltp family lipoprotein n=1 Tax=Blastomonas fulva TaxID=1550728 RepID=UPI003F6EEE6B